ncbi:hypothetical protein pb186bvf_017415 [Paramecium bursaria]
MMNNLSLMCLLITSILACTSPCSTCQGSDTFCLTCSDILRSAEISTGQCFCSSGYVEISNTCQQCLSPCKECQGSDSFCLTCSDILRSADISTGQCLCSSGYVEISNTCQQCLSPCKECSMESTKCVNCLDQNMKLVSNQCICKSGYLSQANQCLKCVSTCSECSDTQFYCTTCANNLTPSNGICICINYTVSGSSCLCNNNWWWMLSYDGNLCKPTCISNCQSCNGFLQCAQCNSAYYLKQNNCEKCNSGCDQCSNSLTCSKCYDYYFLNAQQICTKCCQQNSCMTCTSESCGDCTKCHENYFLSNGTCIKCSLPCYKCTSETVCLTCSQYYAEVINGQCFCVSTSINLNGMCTDCRNPCLTCENTTTYCKTCTDPDFLLNDGICTCPAQTHVPYSDYACQACAPPCKYCLNVDTYCTDCLDITTLQSDNTCKCPDGYAFVQSQLKCKLCTLPCINCKDYQYSCTSCVDPLMYISSSRCYCQAGYINLLNVCQPLHRIIVLLVLISIWIVFTLGGYKCKCKSNYLNKIDICYLCQLPCITCSLEVNFCNSCNDPTMILNNKTCTCKLQQYIDTNYICQNCVSPCQQCSSETSCTSCIQGYALNSNSCLPCISPCVYCSGTDQNYCTSCVDINMEHSLGICTCKQTYAQISNQCQPCISPCLNCLGSQNYCTSCIQEYALIQNACLPCISPCVQCGINDQNYCTSCVDINMDHSLGICTCKQTYAQIQNQCQPCISPCVNCLANQNYCTSCIDNHMIIQQGLCICDAGYYSKTQIQCEICKYPCSTCSSDTNCNSCISAINRTLIGTKCICDFGFYDDGLCKNCPFPCLACNSLQDCTICILDHMNPVLGKCICNQGYVLINQLCQQCDDYCLTCIDTQSNCVECIDVNMDLFTSPKCQCKFGYYQSSPKQCTQCIDPCETCFEIGTFCLSCSKQNQFLDDNKCRCLDGYAEVESLCQLCKLPCSTCAGPVTLCLTCIDPIQQLISGSCICPSNYYYDTSFMCQICQLPCLTCEQSDTFCIKCNDLMMELTNQNQCICKIGYFQNNYKCEKCIEGCEYCSDNSTCILCYFNYMMNQQNICERCLEPCLTCETATHMCTSCLNPKLKAIDNVCQCQSQEYFLEDNCYPCSNYCYSCNSNSCTKCFDFNNLLLIDGYCQCEEGYIDNGSDCQICNSYCQTCQNDVNSCTQCFQTQNRYLKNNQCVCNKGYYEEGILDCIQCTDFSGIDRKECDYKNCLDGIYTWGEQCDDGNLIPRDGCTNCIIDKGYQCTNQILSPSICQTCTLNCADCDENLQCSKCDEGFYLLDQKCLICLNVCQTCDTFSGCRTCKYIKINGKCSTCDKKIGYFLDDESQKCISVCGDGLQSDIEQCDDGNQLNGDGCDQYCNLEKGFIKIGNQIVFRQPLKPQLLEILDNQNIYKPKRTFILTYNYQLQNNTIDFQKYLNISISNQILSQDYNIQLDNLSAFGNDGINFTLKIDLELKISMNQEKLIIQFSKPSQFVAFNQIKQTIKEVQVVISQFQFIDQSAKNTQQNVMNLNQNIIYIMGGLVLLGILTGGIGIFYSILDILQLISYLRYINTDYPYNLDEFFNLFKFAQSSYLNEVLQTQNVYDYIYKYIDKSQIIDPPEKIANDGFSTNILLNIQPILQVWVTFFIFYLTSLVLYQIVLRYRVSSIVHTGYGLKLANFQYFMKKLVLKTSLTFKNQFFWSIFLRTFYSTAYDLSFVIILNLSSFQKQPRYYFNYVGELVSICLIMAYFFIIFKQLGIFKRKKFITVDLINQFGAVKEGLKCNRFSIHFNTFSLLKKMLLMMAILLLDEIPLLQTTSILILNSLTVIYLLLFKPLDQQNEFIKQSASEIYMTILQVLITGFVVDNQIQILNYDQRSFIGWCAIGVITLMIITQIILAFSQQLKIYEIEKQGWKNWNKSKPDHFKQDLIYQIQIQCHHQELNLGSFGHNEKYQPLYDDGVSLGK